MIIDFDKIKEVADKQKADGQKVSVRSVQAVVGGSMTTVLRYFREWQEQQGKQAVVLSEDEKLSENFKKALNAEISANISHVKQALEGQVKASEERALEVEGLLRDSEATIEELKLTVQKDGITEKELRQEIAILGERISQQKGTNLKLEEKLSQLQGVMLESEKRASSAEALASERLVEIQYLKAQLELKVRKKKGKVE